MVAYNFKKQFADAVESGAKRMTIRHRRKHPTRPGDALQLYTGLRTRGVRKLLDARCTHVNQVDIGYEQGMGTNRLLIQVDGEPIGPFERTALARADGFESVQHFVRFFADTYGLPFSGEIIEWVKLDQPTAAHAASEGE